MENIKKLVDEIVSDCRTRDPYKIAKMYDIEIVIADLGEIKGLFKIILGNKFIALNENLSEFLSTMVLAHELGHAFLHEDDEILEIKENVLYSANFFEREANIFAANLLMGGEDEEKIYYPENIYEEKIYNSLRKLI